MRSIPKKFYDSKPWIDTRDKYRNKVVFCERCGRLGRIVHHKIHLTLDNYQDKKLAYGQDNLELLCIPCHNQEHFGNQDTRYIISKDGKVLPPK